MLPGTRTYSDEDIVSIVVDSLFVFDNLVERGIVPEDLRLAVFGICHTMVGNRQIVGDAGLFNRLGALPRDH